MFAGASIAWWLGLAVVAGAVTVLVLLPEAEANAQPRADLLRSPLPELAEIYVERRGPLGELEAVRLRKSGMRNTAIVGGSGRGKTQLACFWARAWSIGGAGMVWWVDCGGGEAAFDGGMRYLAGSMGLSTKGPLRSVVGRIEDYLRVRTDLWLLVLDDFGGAAVSLPSLPNGVCLLTTRRESTARAVGAEVVRVSAYTPEEAIEHVCRATGDSDVRPAEALAKELSFDPRAIGRVASRLRHLRLSNKRGLAWYRRSQSANQHSVPPDLVDALPAWRAELEGLGPELEQVLRICSCLAPSEPAPVELIASAIDHVGPTVVLGWVHALADFSLISYDPVDGVLGSVRMHELDQRSVHLLRPDELSGDRLRLAVGATNWSRVLDPKLFSDWPNLRRLDVHMLHVLRSDHDLVSRTVDALVVVGRFRLHSGDVDGAIELLRTLRSTLYPQEPPIELERAMGEVLWTEGVYHEAAAVEGQVLRRRLNDPNSTFEQIVDARSNLGVTYWSAGEFDLAQHHLEEAERLASRELPADHLLQVEVLNNYALLLRDLGRHEEAESYARRVVDLVRSGMDGESVDAETYSANLGVILNELGRHDEALELNTEALRNREAVLPANHEKVLQARHNLAFTMFKLGRTAEAIEIEERVLLSQAKTLRPTHLQLLQTTNALSRMYLAEGECERAIEALDRALGLADELGPDTPIRLELEESKALGLWMRGERQSARKLLARVLEGRERGLPNNHPTIAGTRTLLKEWGGTSGSRSREAIAEVGGDGPFGPTGQGFV